MISSDRHQREILQNQASWTRKPLLQRIYREFHRQIAQQLSDLSGLTVEVGSGVGNIRDVIPNCLRTDLFPNPWLDRVENVYQLSFETGSAANVILFDVFHHLRYPGTALMELHRVLAPGGHLIIFEPRISLLGALVYGPLHHEPIAMSEPITWFAPPGWSPSEHDYYAAQGNATRVFLRRAAELPGWRLHGLVELSALSYVASGGYSKPQLYPDSWYPLISSLERALDRLPGLFATRMLIVLEREP